MKARWIGIPAAALIIISAGQVLTDETPPDKVPTDLTPATTLIKKSGCFECHSVDQKGIGPAFHDIATRYKDDTRAHDALIETVKKGGKGNWTEISRGVPMPPFSRRLSDAEIKRLVDWVLGL
jgi:cytochrome c